MRSRMAQTLQFQISWRDQDKSKWSSDGYEIVSFVSHLTWGPMFRYEGLEEEPLYRFLYLSDRTVWTDKTVNQHEL
jgi:hypothetical protein